MVWEDMADCSARLPGSHSVAIFWARRKNKKKAVSIWHDVLI
jgi:hypothetical protein